MPISSEQLDELRSCFELVASTSGGDFVTADQLNSLWQAAGHVIDEEQVSALLREANLDSAAKIYFQDFLKMLKIQAQASKEKEIEYAFLALTKGNNKVLDAATLKTNLDEAKAEFTEEECERLVTLIGGSSAKSIDFELFRDFMRREK